MSIGEGVLSVLEADGITLVGLIDRVLGGGQARVRVVQRFLSVLDRKLVLVERGLDLAPVGVEGCELLLISLLRVRERRLVRLERCFRGGRIHVDTAHYNAVTSCVCHERVRRPEPHRLRVQQ